MKQKKHSTRILILVLRQSIIRFIFGVFFVLNNLESNLCLALSTPRVSYFEAQEVRILKGHAAAVPLYRSLLDFEGNDDFTAASLIAASDKSPERQDMACKVEGNDNFEKDIADLRAILLESGFTRDGVAKLFGVDVESVYGSSLGPAFAKSAKAGSSCPTQLTKPSTSLEFLVKLFILGFAVPRFDLEAVIIGGSKTVKLLEKFGFLFLSEHHSGNDIMVPYIHLFPMEVDGFQLLFATDWHPITLAATSVGTKNDGSVMYIGPDSLALQQHMPVQNIPYRNAKGHRKNANILDLCCGSGIQGICSLFRYMNEADVISIDVNCRALRFTRFNALLNEVSDRVNTVWGDLSRFPLSKELNTYLFGMHPEGYNLILANPPFLPVPDIDKTSQINSVSLRYGFFSDGGSTGEMLLETIIRISSTVLCPGGFVGVVSEFMNPGTSLCNKLEHWWNQQNRIGAIGVLLTNEVPVSDELYALRRAADEVEQKVWLEHLKKYHVSSKILQE